MSFRLNALTPTVIAAPGERVIGRVEIHNDANAAAAYTVRIIGLDSDPTTENLAAPIQVSIDAGQSASVEVPVVVPSMLGIGQHAAAFEATSDRAGDRAALTPFTVSIASVSRVEMVAVPSTIRSRRKGSFHLDVTNNEPQSVDVSISGEAPDVDVQFTPSAFTLQPGQRTVAKGKVKGPHRWAGEPTQHNVLITARGRASSTSITTPYVQRPLFAHRMRMVLAAFTVVALWLAAIGGVAFWLATRDNGSEAESAELVGVDTDGDGIPDAFYNNGQPVTGTDTDGDGIPDSFKNADGTPVTGLDTDGDGIPDALVTRDGKPIEAVDTDGDGVPDALSDGSPIEAPTEEAVAEPQATILRGTVKIDGDPTEVAIALTPIALGAQPDDNATPIGFRGTEPTAPTGKIWSARYGVVDGLSSGTRHTVSVANPSTTNPSDDGVFLFTDVLQGQSYEVSFSKAGFQTQSFVVTPADDGQPIDLDVEMEPAKGSLSGTVAGPSGRLGGAAIKITDGTLVFETTSDSTTGNFSVDGVSTPGVYTMTATLRGYATAVRQVELSPGDDSSGITLQMAPGLGTVSGHIVDNTGEAAGGVTITASNGDTTLTSTSLTEGDIGFFSLPQLPVPATYTVTAELEGFVTQSRRVPLSGSVGNVNFTMRSETITLTGRVTGLDGKGIANAGLIVSTGDLTFRSSTSAAPSPGNFSIDRLPPGTYTITVEHYQHENATEFLTIQPGETPQPLSIVMKPTDGPPAIGTGALVVKVVNNDVGGDRITDATVTIHRNRSGAAPRVLDGADQLGVTFTDVAVGTYTVIASKEGFNTSLAETVSVGLSQQEITIRLQALGSASGTIVDARDPSVRLDGYRVSLQRLDSQGKPIGNPYGQFAPDGADNSWQTDSSSLLPTGTYQLIVDPPPSGYSVRSDQTLTVVPKEYGLPNARFVVPQVSKGPVPSLQITAVADPYPNITGRVYTPQWTDGHVTFKDLDDNSLDVTATCQGATMTQGVEVSGITYSDAGGDNSLNDAYTIRGADIAAAIPQDQLPATCDLTVKADHRMTETVEDVPVDIKTDGSNPDLLVATALTKPAPTIGGTVFWVDGSAAPGSQIVPLQAAIATTSPRAITDFVSNIGPAATVVEPGYLTDKVTGPITSTSDATDSGKWTAPSSASTAPQVFGPATYQFTADEFQVGNLQILIDETGQPRIEGTPSGAKVSVVGGAFDVELIPPNQGSITGTVTIDSTTRSYSSDMVTATGVGNPPGSELATTPAADGSFSFVPVDAGTWTVSFATPPNHELISPVGGSIEKRVDPGTETGGFDARFVEQGAIEVRLSNRGSSPGSAVTTDPTFTLTTGGANVPVSVAETGADTGVFRISGIPVDAADPVNTEVPYELAVSVPGYDMVRAVIDSVPVNANHISTPMVAGRLTTLNVSIAEFGTIQGALVGHPSDSAGTEPLSIDTASDPHAVVAIERLDTADPDDPPANVVAGPGDSFIVTGPPGIYRLTPTHPQYLPAYSVPTQATGYPQIDGSGVYEIGVATHSVLGDFDAKLRPSALTIQAVTQLTGGTPVTGAVYQLQSGTGTCTITAVNAMALPTEPLAIDPGNYCLAISKFRSDGHHDVFPAIVKLAIPRSTADSTNTTAVVAPLPSLHPQLIGHLKAVNAADETITLIADPKPMLTREFTGNIDVSVNGTPATNEGSEPRPATLSVQAQPPADPTTDLSWTYTFVDVPLGANKITAPEIDGYTLATAEKTITVPDFGPALAPDFEYVAASAPVAIDIGPGNYPSLDPNDPTYDSQWRTTVTLTSPDGNTDYGGGSSKTYTFETIAATGTQPATNLLVIPGVSPADGNFTLTFDDVLHEKVDAQALTIAQELHGTTSPRREAKLATAPAGDKVRLTGTAVLQPGTDATVVTGMSGDAKITVQGGYELEAGDTSTATAGFLDDNVYYIDVDPGTRDVSLTRGEYVPQNVPSVALTSAGNLVAQNLRIVRMAKVVVKTFTGPEATAGLADPPSFGVVLRPSSPNSTAADNITPTESDPADPSGTPAKNSGTYTFVVPAGAYDVRTTSGGSYPEQTKTNQTLAIGTGWASPQTVKLALPRYVVVDVTGIASSTTATVTLTSGSTSYDKTVTGPQQVTFTDNDSTTADKIPSTGSLSVEVTATGYRPNTATIGAAIFDSQSVELHPDVTVTGSIPGATKNKTITASASGQVDVDGTISTAGNYTITGLGIGTWKVTYDEIGVGKTSAPVEIATIMATDPATGTKGGNTITLIAQDVDFEFTVNDVAAAGIEGASVKLYDAAGQQVGSTGTTLADDTTTTSVDESGTVTIVGTERVRSWKITKSGYLTQSGSVSATRTSPTSISATLQPPVAGTVTDSTDTAVDSATVRLCDGATTSICQQSDSLAHDSTSAAGAFTLSFPTTLGTAVTYKLWAKNGSKVTSVGLTVNAAGVVPSSPVTLKLP